MKTKKVRSGPVYLDGQHGTVSLVFEASVREDTGAAIGRPDVYVIDDSGVSLMRHHSRLARAALIGVVAYVVMWVVVRILGAAK